jgi:hypothetical protein
VLSQPLWRVRMRRSCLVCQKTSNGGAPLAQPSGKDMHVAHHIDSCRVRGKLQGCTCRYELYQPLNVLWQAYAGKLLQSPNMGDLLQVRVSTTGMASIYAQHDMLLPCLNALFVIV